MSDSLEQRARQMFLEAEGLSHDIPLAESTDQWGYLVDRAWQLTEASARLAVNLERECWRVEEAKWEGSGSQ